MNPNRMGNPDPVCGFCDGTGVWCDSDEKPAASTDPCPLCEGTGRPPASATGDDASAAYVEATLPGVLATLPRLSQGERDQVYEELYIRYDCRIHRG